MHRIYYMHQMFQTVHVIKVTTEAMAFSVLRLLYLVVIRTPRCALKFFTCKHDQRQQVSPFPRFYLTTGEEKRETFLSKSYQVYYK